MAFGEECIEGRRLCLDAVARHSDVIVSPDCCGPRHLLEITRLTAISCCLV